MVWKIAWDFLCAFGAGVGDFLGRQSARSRVGGAMIGLVTIILLLSWLGLPVGFFDLLEVAAVGVLFLGTFFPGALSKVLAPKAPKWIAWTIFGVSFILMSVYLLHFRIGRTVIGLAIVIPCALAWWLSKRTTLAESWKTSVSGWIVKRFIPIGLALLYVPVIFLLRPVECKILDTERESDRAAYAVRTDYGAKSASQEGECFDSIDIPRIGKFASGELEGLLEQHKGQTVTLWVTGVRVPWWPGETGGLRRHIWWAEVPESEVDRASTH